MKITPQEISKEFLGIPYEHLGRTRDGIDCWGLIIAIYKRLGYAVWETDEPYNEKGKFKADNHFIENYWREWVQVKKPKPFDLVLLNNGAGVIDHAGVLLDEVKFIHASRAGVVITRMGHRAISSKISGYFHLKVMTA